jgi:hypothetical protein
MGARNWVYAALMAILPQMAAAQDIPDSVAAQIGRDPEGYFEDIAVIIAGYGSGGAIDAAGLQTLVALARADARALGFRRLQGADLDGDGAIAGDEMRSKAAASAAGARGRLMVNFAKADGNGDDMVSAEELQTYANAVALENFSNQRAAQVYAVMGFDSNGDGRVTVAEVRSAIDLIQARSAADAAKAEKNI